MRSSTRMLGAIVGIVFGCFLATANSHASVVINEIDYHILNSSVPTGEDPERLEFIELYNTGPGTADLSSWSFSQGVVYTFPPGTALDAGQYLVVAADPVALAQWGPAVPGGVQVLPGAPGASSLDNAGETITLLNAALAVVDTVIYDDGGIWPTTADGRGPSLELINPTYDKAYPLAWKASAATNGTPGWINSTFTEGPAVLWEDPVRRSVVPSLTQVRVVFAEPVTGVVAADLKVAASPAITVTGSGAGPYVFTGFASPTVATFDVTLGPGAIQDLQAHAYAGDSWIYSLSVPKVVINEIHYNPNTSDDMEEFIEIMNSDSVPVDLSGWTLMEFASPGVTFPPGTVLDPGARLVAAKDPTTLAARLGCVTTFTWGSGDSLSNSGEPVALRDANGVLVDRVYYDDDTPWPTTPDGSGPSLERINPSAGTPCTSATQPECTWQASAWAASLVTNGTCGAQNSVYSSAPQVSTTDPARGALVAVLTQVSVTFSETVTGVTADDLTVDGVSATNVSGSGAGPYVFTVTPPAPGTLEVVLRADGGISDLQSVPFAGDSWLYFYGLPQIVINEIHFHPAVASVLTGENPEDLQFLELYNAGTTAVEMSGYALSEGVALTFPAGTTLAPGAYLVVAENATFLRSKVTIPTGVSVLQWADGNLANGGETVELIDSYGHVLDSVTYDDGGEWSSVPDGNGPSLELVNPIMPNQYGNAWRPSLVNIGTPGAVNGRYVAEAPPVISAVHHNPPIPGASQPVTITAFVIDESVTPTVTLYYRQDQEPTIAYASVAMLDDGLHGDGAAGDNVYGVVLAGLAEGQRLDFAVRVSDGTSSSIAPIAHDGNFPGAGGHPPQVFLCKFSSAALPTDFPSYHLITTQYTRNRQATRDKTEYDAAFLRCPATGVMSQCEVFYNATERYRGASSLYQNPPSFRIDLPGDHPMTSEMGFTIKSINMLGQQPARQGVGYGLFDAAGLPHPKVHFPRFNTNPLADGGTQNGMYSNVERIDEDFFTSQAGAIQPLRFPNRCSISETVCGSDPDCPPGETCVQTDIGNCYRGRHDDSSLRWEGYDPNAYRVDANERNGYQKITNEEEDQWTDLITLCDAMNCSTSDGGALCLENTYDSWFQNNLASYVDVEQWARWFAVHMLLANNEGGLYLDTGDDYFLYLWPGPGYGHATMLPWDMDAIIPADTSMPIWRTGYNNSNWPVRRVLRNNAYAGLFVGAICEYMDTAFSQASMYTLIDSMPDVLFPTGVPQGNGPQYKQGMKDWVAAQRTRINGQIRRQTTLQGVPASPYTSSSPLIALSGQLNQCWAREVRVNGLPATYTIANPDGVGATWSYNFTLTPGMNHITVQTLNHQGAEIDRAEGDVFYNPAGAQHDNLRLILPQRMYNQKTMTIAADIINIAGGVDWKVWEAVGTVSIVKLPERTPAAITTTVFDPHVTDPNGSIRFYNGRGTVSFTLNDGAAAPAGNYELSVNVTVDGNALSASKTFTVLSAPAFRTLSGTLSGGDLTWGPDEEIHLTGSVTVPGGSTLTINPGTLIMIDAGSFQSGTLIIVNGNMNAVGTQANPIFIFPTNGASALTLTQSGSASNGDCWRGIDLYGTGTSTMRWVFLTGAGNGDVISHPRPPVIATRDRHTVNVDYSFFVDNDGMVFSAPSPGLFTIRNSVLQRAGIGAEFQSDGNYLLLEDTYFARIGHAPEANNLDGDHLHIDGSSSNQTIRRCIFSDGGDDGIDHNASTFTLDSVIVHDIRDKCISMTGGLAHLKNFLCFGSGSGVRGTADGEHVTINVGAPIGGIGSAGLTESIIWPSSICSANLSYSDVGNSADASCGTSNFSSNPLFNGTHDFDLQAGSPALTAGNGGTRIGWLGWPYASTCSTSEDCNDSNACTYDECTGGQCSYTPIPNCASCESDAQCDDGNACTDDACDLGACRHVDNTATCSDGNACTSGDHCTSGACVGSTVTCNDSNACTTDSCDTSTGCVYTPITCNDGNPCTDDSCNTSTGCVYTADNTNTCSDAVACTADSCSGGACVSTDSCLGGLTCDHGTGQCLTGPRTTSFQQGVNGYTGVVDTYIDATLGSQAATTPIVVDGSPEEQVLLRFDNIFGPGANQIPLGSSIVSATLTIRVGSGANDQSANAVNFHRLLAGWLAPDVWSVYGDPPWNTTDGIQADNGDALSTSDATATMTTASTAYPVNVTTSLQAWAVSPPTNYGWVILPTGTDGLRLESSESTTVSYRPLLSVTYAPPAGACTGDAQCDDGLWCNGAETCNLATQICQAATARSCDDAIACTTDSCNETTDSCDHTANDAACSDGLVCNGTETCNLVSGCQSGTTLNCSDGVACTTDSCVEPSGCQHEDNCTGGQTCNHSTGVCSTGPVTMTFQQGDSNGYGGTADTYIGSGLASQAASNPLVMDLDPVVEQGLIRFDGIFGSGANQIPQGSTIVSATLTLRVGGTTYDESPNPVNFYSLLHPWVDTGLWADYGASPWNATAGIQADGTDALATADATATLSALNTSYPVDVTARVQAWANDPASSYGWAILMTTGTDGLRAQSAESTTVSYRPLLSVTYTPPLTACTSDPQCNDGVYCNGVETCNLGTSTCQAGTPPSCDDGVACTVDGCNETTDSCDHAANNAACSDGNVCNGTEACDPVGGCLPGTALNCDDGLYCNGAETCDAALGCRAGTAPSCDDGIACTADSCNETTDACEHGLCSTMTVVASGPRYLAVTPPGGVASLAIKVGAAALSCLPQYVGADGLLTATPYYQSAAAWGTVYVRGRPVIPSTAYTVEAEVPGGQIIGSAVVTTWAWGDTNLANGVDVFDVLCVLDGSRGVFTKCPLQAADLTGAGFVPDGIVDEQDINAVLDGFRSQPYPDSNPCVGR